MLDAWLGLRQRVEVTGEMATFSGQGVRCRRQELGLGFFCWLCCMAFRVLVP